MAENKTKPTGASIEDYIASRASDQQKMLLAKLGRHRMGKSCLYFRQLADLDQAVLKQIVTNSVAGVKRRYE